MLIIKAMTGGEGYAANHLSNSDYYAEGEKVIGQWMGHGAKLLGLEGEVTMEQFEAIRQGNDPKTGEYLKQRKNSNSIVERETKNGEIITDERKVRALYDCTFSAPKALSVLALEDPETAKLAHDAGVAAGAAEMESLAGARIRKGGANDTRITSNLVIARYDHTASRALDPDQHSHLVAANLSFDGVEGIWKALDAKEMYQQTSYLTAVYRNASAAVLHERGYETYARSLKGKHNGYGIVGIAEPTLEKFSKRTTQKEAAIQDFIRENGRQPSKNEIATLVRETRDKKLTAITTAEVVARQRAGLASDEDRSLKAIHQSAQECGSIREYAAAAPSLTYAVDHTFERISVAKEHELKTEALNHGCGKIDLSELKGTIAARIATGEMIGARGEVATHESLERERRMVATVNQGIGKFEALGRDRQFVVSDRLKPEQKAAVIGVLNSTDLVYEVSGAAGVGKTTLLKEVRRGLTEARRSIVAVAPSTSAVEQLQIDDFPQAITIAELLISPQKQAQLRGQVLIVDEAGMVGSKQMDELLQLASKEKARLLTVGDVKQIKAVEAGDALRILEQHSDMRGVSVREVQRQTNPQLKAAVEALRSHPAEGYDRLEKKGAIREVHWRERAIEVSKAYQEFTAVTNAKGERRSVLVMAATHEEIGNVTHAIRTDLKRGGKLADGQEVTKHSALNWTEAQKKQTNRYQPGQVLEFHKALSGLVKKNESLEVIKGGKQALTARRANGQIVRLSAQHSHAFGVFEKEQLEVSAGDKLLLQANRRDKHFRATNGELVTVASVDYGSIQLEDGRRLPAGYRQFTHGYAITAHRSQAKTVDASIISADRMNQDQFYVAATRSRQETVVITSDSLGLQESIGVSADRQSAIELAERAAAIRAQGQHYEAQIQAPTLSKKPAQIERHIEKENYANSIGY
jgi:conjugative relaxase-like TrwC/TraI family protein